MRPGSATNWLILSEQTNRWKNNKDTKMCNSPNCFIEEGHLPCLALVVHRYETQLYILKASIFIRFWWHLLLCIQSHLSFTYVLCCHQKSLPTIQPYVTPSDIVRLLTKQLSDSGHNQFPRIMSRIPGQCTGLFSFISVYNFHFIGAIRPFSAHKGNYCAFGWLSKSLGL